MLHYETIDPATLELLRALQKLYSAKYPDGSLFIALKSLTYFDDAEADPMPEMLVPAEWDEIKKLSHTR